MTEGYILAWLRAFVFTQLVEVPIYMRLARTTPAVAFGASAITHPILWFVIFPLMPGGFAVKLAVGELFAWLGEAAYLRYVVRVEPSLARALAWSLIANAASAGLGELCRALTGLP